MDGGRLSALQRRALELLAGLEPPWTLAGDGAIVGFVLGHRATRDLDLFWRDRSQLGAIVRVVQERFVAAGLAVQTLQTSPAFVRLRVADGEEVLVVDLIAAPIQPVETPVEVAPGVFVDTAHELLVQKLCTLLSRSEPRDLEDTRALIAAGGDLDRALGDAARRGGGFSPPTLAWLLESYPLEQAARLGFDPQALAAFRDWLREALLK